jgi:hypothetical protein
MTLLGMIGNSSLDIDIDIDIDDGDGGQSHTTYGQRNS